MKNHLYEWKKNSISLIISIKIKFSEALINLIAIQGQNKYNSESQMKYLDKELYEYYYFSLHKSLNSLKHLVYYLTK
jgi:hypothetical protein